MVTRGKMVVTGMVVLVMAGSIRVEYGARIGGIAAGPSRVFAQEVRKGEESPVAAKVRRILDQYDRRHRWSSEDAEHKELLAVGHAAVPVLLDEVERPTANRPGLRAHVIQHALKALCTKEDVPRLRRLILAHDDVAPALATVEGAAAVPILIEALKAASGEDGRGETTEILGALRVKEAVPVLISRLEEHCRAPLTFLGQNEAWALGNIGDASAGPVLKEWIAKAVPRADPEYRDQLKRVGAEALLRLGDPEGLNIMINCLSSEEEYTRDLAIHTLENVTGTTHDYRADDPPEKREKSVERWRRWRKEEGQNLKPHLLPEEIEGVEQQPEAVAEQMDETFSEDNAAFYYKKAFGQMVNPPNTGEMWEKFQGIVRYGWMGEDQGLADILAKNLPTFEAVGKAAGMSTCVIGSGRRVPFWESQRMEGAEPIRSFKGYDLSRLLVARAAQLEREGKREEAIRTCVDCVKAFQDLARARDRRYAPGYVVEVLWGQAVAQAHHLALDSLERILKQPFPDAAFGRKVLKELDRIASPERYIQGKLGVLDEENPDWDDAWERYVPLRTQIAALRVIAALQTYKAEHGDYEDTLEALVPTILQMMPVDPMSGEPFRFECMDDGWRLWSVGADKKDDGGEVLYDGKTGKGDIVFSSKRNRPPREFLKKGGLFNRQEALDLLAEEMGVVDVRPDPLDAKRAWIVLREGSVAVHEADPGRLRVFENWIGYAEYLSSLALSQKDMLAIVSLRKKVLSRVEDPFQRQSVWLALDGGPLCLWNDEAKRLQAFECLMGYPRIAVSGIVPLKDAVWVGADCGLLRYERTTGAWNRYPVGGDAKLFETKVVSIRAENGAALLVTIEHQGKRQSYLYDPAANTWGKTEDRGPK